MMGRRLRACALGLLLSLPVPPGPALPAAAIAAAAAVVAAVPGEAEARPRSSGGYSRPGGSSARTPSFGGGRAAVRTPSTSGGYGRPYATSPGYPARLPSTAGPSAGDRAFSRQQSADALGRYRDQQAAARQAQAPRFPPAAPADGSRPYGGGTSGNYGRGGSYGGYGPRAGYGSGWFGSRGWTAPDYAYRSRPSFGVWNGLFLWFLLDNLTRPGYGDFFYNHQNDPGYQQWRAEAERLARENADVRQKLDTLDRQVAAKQGQPQDPDYLPPDTPPEVAVAAGEDARTPSTADVAGGGAGLGVPSMLVLALAGGAIVFVIWRRRSSGRAAARAGGGGPVDTLRSAGNILRHKLSGEGYAPSRFRVGMTLTLDPAPFILAAGSTKVPAPDPGGGNTLVSVEAVGRLGTGASALTRLYLPGGTGFFQLHLGADGGPDECRYFGRIDEVTPADPSEWAFWLDPAEGMIGWPEFQTKDGKIYPRAWAPGTGRIEPRAFDETVETAGGSRTVRSRAMLYAAPTGAASPAPQAEYVLVAAVEADGQAWVEVHAGIDVSPAALSLA
jgi:Protein of unknown function (DUF2491)